MLTVIKSTTFDLRLFTGSLTRYNVLTGQLIHLSDYKGLQKLKMRHM